MNDKENYNYNLYTNDKGLFEFAEKTNTSNILNANLVRVLSFLIYLCDKTTSLSTITHKGKKCVLVMDKLIYSNLKFISKEPRTIKRYLHILKKSGYIHVIVLEKYKRYISIDDTLLEYWNGRTGKGFLQASELLFKYDKNGFKFLKQQYEPYIKEDYTTVLLEFNSSYVIRENNPMNAITIFERLRDYLETCVRNDKLGNHKNQRFNN